MVSITSPTPKPMEIQLLSKNVRTIVLTVVLTVVLMYVLTIVFHTFMKIGVNMQVLTIINAKGGVGKTTVSVNLSFELARAEKRVLLIDLDHQAHSSCIYSENVNKNDSIGMLFDNGTTDITKLIRPAILMNDKKEKIQNLDIIPSTIHLARTAEQAVNRVHKEKILQKSLAAITSRYDYTIIDCSPTLNTLNLNALFASNTVIIPTTYARYSVDGISDLLDILSEVKEGSEFKYKVLRNSLDARTTQTNLAIEEQLNVLKDNLYTTIVRKSEPLNQAQLVGLPVRAFDPTSTGCICFYELAKEVLEDEKK